MEPEAPVQPPRVRGFFFAEAARAKQTVQPPRKPCLKRGGDAGGNLPREGETFFERVISIPRPKLTRWAGSMGRKPIGRDQKKQRPLRRGLCQCRRGLAKNGGGGASNQSD